ncbi:monofunctional biosynthetic peptidoglycan transglycosylase [Citreicella sp. SE45]|uniref:Biosynthetic peptidoglycan transglycosylase n=2 Tax=Roseobacteraceae TaxID=2854170 RepID=A0A1G7F6A6_9RHOB|nr:monofunctional biosynthetic peptidoglycan transglycosylase [Citreicella sp. SE45]SDE71125.1 monofunctional biosynthetic peptidoglycan transglycosylase [Salipiger thiooxidans]
MGCANTDDMARTSRKKQTKAGKTKDLRTAVAEPLRRANPVRWLTRMALRAALALLAAGFVLVLAYKVLNPPTTYTMWSEGRRLGGPVDYDWVDAEEMAPVMLRSVVAAEDANFCTHWGFDMRAIRAAIAEGSNRGASTISQQTVKNAYLWQGRNWLRKALEAGVTPLVEAVWSKKRILEVYLNIAEFDEGVFGVEAAAEHYFGVSAKNLSATQAARLAAILPDPKDRSASRPSAFVERRASQIRDGAATIARDGRADCFE